MTKKKKKVQGGKGKLSLNGGGNKLAVFDFDDDEYNVEQNSRKHAAKYAPKSPNKPLIDKYTFLNAFNRGKTSQQNSSGNEMSISDVSDSVLKYGKKQSPGTMFKSLSISTNSRVIGANKVGKAGGCKLEKKSKHVHNLDSDEEEIVYMKTSTSYDLVKDRGSLQEEVSSQRCPDAIDCEAVVVVSPIYVKVGNVSYTNCSLAFSSSCIRLVGYVYGKTESHSRQWSTSDIAKIEHQIRESAEVLNLLLRFGDSDVNETCKTNSGILELEFVVIDEAEWCKKQEEIRSLNTKYKSAWETISSEFSFIEHFDDIVYPEGDPDAIFISQGDVDRLKPTTFLNDTIIDFYIKYLLNKTKPEEKRRLHFFNTFFFRKLADMDQVSSGTWDAREAFQRVRKWTRNVDLFSKDYIFIPVNFSLHWSLIVICHPGELVNIRDKDFADSSVRPCILHMDSLRGSHRGLENLLRSYLREEWRARDDKKDSDICEKFSSLNFDALQLPQQENFFDCGLFLLHYAELFLAQAANFRTAKYSDVLNKAWFLPAEVSVKKRHHIRKLISKLASENAGKERQGACSDKNISINEGDKSIEIVSRRDVKETSDVNSCQLVNDRSLQQFEQLVSTSRTSCKRLTLENSFPEDIRSLSEADEGLLSTPVHLTPTSFKVGEIEVPLDVSKFSSGVSQRTIYINKVEHPLYEVTCTPEIMKQNFLHCSEPIDDVPHLIVEDSEEEDCWAEITRMTRRSTLRGICRSGRELHQLA